MKQKPSPLRGVQAVVIRKSSPEGLGLRRLREYLLLSKLRSLLPPLQRDSSSSSEGATEYEPERNEIPAGDSDEENAEASTRPSVGDDHNDASDSEGVVFKEEEGDGVEAEKPFVPSIKIKRMDDSLLISTVVLKDVALTSALFRVFEEEKLDIVFENQYRTETRVAHTLQVRAGSEYDIDALEKKLCVWAGKPI